MSPFYTSRGVFTRSFRLVENAFLQSEGLPFAGVLPEEEIREAFVAANACFAEDEGDTYTPAVTLWGWLSQTLHAGALRSCAAAVARVSVLCVMLEREPPSPDTGDYCRARAKLPERVLQQLTYRVGDALESRVPADWLWLGRHVKIGDGTTLLTPDTPANQHAWPQARSREARRGVSHLADGGAIVVGYGGGVRGGGRPYKGKQTGEPALLRELLDRFQAGDVFLGDCCFASYFLLALLLARGVDSVVRQHQRRRDRLPPRRKTGAEGSCRGLAAARLSGIDGPRNLCADSGNDKRARTGSACGGPRVSRAAARGGDYADRCASLSARGSCRLSAPGETWNSI